MYYEAALVYLRLAKRTTPEGARHGPGDARALEEACTNHAQSMLEAAEKAGYFRIAEGVKLLNSDKHLDPIRSRDSFQQLLTRVREK
jgi:hypothetical protein